MLLLRQKLSSQVVAVDDDFLGVVERVGQDAGLVDLRDPFTPIPRRFVIAQVDLRRLFIIIQLLVVVRARRVHAIETVRLRLPSRGWEQGHLSDVLLERHLAEIMIHDMVRVA